MANGQRFIASGLVMGGFMTSGFVRSWYGEALKAQLVEVGDMISGYIQEGMLQKVNGGQLATALGDKIVADLAAELEK